MAFTTDDKYPESDHAPVNAYFSVPDSWLLWDRNNLVMLHLFN
jgi:hypothetical protein